MTARVSKVVVAKLGLDGHDVGINLIARALSANGFDVVYLGKRVPVENIVEAVVTEDAAAVGLSCLSGGLAHFSTKVVAELRAAHNDAPVLVGGIDEPTEIRKMLSTGVSRYFPPGTPIADVVAAFRAAVGGA